MIGEAVAGMTSVERPHQCIARDLRTTGGSRDAGGFRVAPDDRLLRIAISFKRFASAPRVDEISCCGIWVNSPHAFYPSSFSRGRDRLGSFVAARLVSL